MNTKIDLEKVINIDAKLDEKESKLRIELLNAMIEKRKPLTEEKFCGDNRSIIDSLIEKETIVTDGEEILFAYPVSNLPTSHHVKLKDGREFYSMCAIDAMGSAFVFNQDINIESVCPVSGEKIQVSICNGELTEYQPHSLCAIHVDLSKVENWAANC